MIQFHHKSFFALDVAVLEVVQFLLDVDGNAAEDFVVLGYVVLAAQLTVEIVADLVAVLDFLVRVLLAVEFLRVKAKVFTNV